MTVKDPSMQFYHKREQSWIQEAIFLKKLI